MTANQRFHKATEQTKRLAIVLSTLGTSQFKKRLGLLKGVLACWEAGTEPSIRELLLSDESATSDSTEDDLEIPLENLKIPLVNDVLVAGCALCF